MVTVRNEFEAIPAFEHLAGSSFGTWSDLEVTETMLEIARKVSSTTFLPDLEPSEDDAQCVHYMVQQECAEEIQHHVAPFCTVELLDNEWRVLPYIDDELPQVEDYPEEHIGDYILQVNDHGNVTLLEWQYNQNDYRSVWAMV